MTDANWKRKEREAAAALGVTRVVRRHHGEVAPDVTALRLDDGTVVQAEVKSRKHPIKFIDKTLAQAAKYTPGAIPIAVVSASGKGAIVCLDLNAFVRLLGIRHPKAGEQLALLAKEAT